jgi:hypothetical protein
MVGLINYITNQITGTVGQIDADQLLTLVVAYGATVGLDTISLGPVVQHDQYWAPDWVSFQSQSLTTGWCDADADPESEHDPGSRSARSSRSTTTTKSSWFLRSTTSTCSSERVRASSTWVQAISTPQIISRMQTYSNGQPPTTLARP